MHRRLPTVVPHRPSTKTSGWSCPAALSAPAVGPRRSLALLDHVGLFMWVDGCEEMRHFPSCVDQKLYDRPVAARRTGKPHPPVLSDASASSRSSAPQLLHRQQEITYVTNNPPANDPAPEPATPPQAATPTPDTPSEPDVTLPAPPEEGPVIRTIRRLRKARSPFRRRN